MVNNNNNNIDKAWEGKMNNELSMNLAIRGVINPNEIRTIVLDSDAYSRVKEMLTEAGFKYSGGSVDTYHHSGDIDFGSMWMHSEETWTEENKHEIVHFNYKTIDALDKAGKFMSDAELLTSDLISDRLLFAIPANKLSAKGKAMHKVWNFKGVSYGTDNNFTAESNLREAAHAERHA